MIDELAWDSLYFMGCDRRNYADAKDFCSKHNAKLARFIHAPHFRVFNEKFLNQATEEERNDVKNYAIYTDLYCKNGGNDIENLLCTCEH